MRKAIFSISILAMMAVTLFSMTSCGDDKDETKPAEEVKVKEALFTVKTKPNADMLKYTDLCVTTTVGEGEPVTHVIDATHTECSVTVESANFPTTVKVEYTCTKKAGVRPEDDYKVEIPHDFTVARYQIKTDGTKEQVIDNPEYAYTATSSFMGNKWDLLVSQIFSHTRTYAIGMYGSITTQKD